MPKPADYRDTFYWVSQPILAAAKRSDRKPCSTCKPDETPGYIYNANQWINCPKCNPTKEVKDV